MIIDEMVNNTTTQGGDQKKQIIYILGSNTLQHQFLEYVFNIEIAGICFVCPNFQTIHSHRSHYSDIESYQELILIDSQDYSFEEILKNLTTEANKFNNEVVISLFNLTPNTEVEKKALSKQVRGFFYKQDTFELFLKGIRCLFQGEFWISRKILLNYVMESLVEKQKTLRKETNLTQREIEILNMISMGAQNDEIADHMNISPNTVKTHLYNIFKKIDVQNRLQAALWAAKYI